MMITWLLCAVIILIICTYLYKHLRWVHRANSLTADVPGWRALPLLGNALKFIGNTEVIVFAQNIAKIAESNGGRFKLWMGPEFFLFTTRPDDIKLINNTFLDKTPFYKFADLWIKGGLTVAPGNIWRESLKRVQHSFSASTVDNFQPIFNVYAKKILFHLMKEVDKGPFDAYRQYVSYVTLEAICHTMMGVTNIDESIVTKEYYESFDKVMHLLMKRIQNILHYPDFMYRLSGDYREFKKSVEILHSVTRIVIEKNRKEFEEKKKNNNLIQHKKDDKKFQSLLDKLLEQSETDPSLDNEQIQSYTDNFISAGQETTALSSSLILIMLGSNPRVQEKLYQEIKHIFGDSDRDVTKDDLERMIYCESVIYETLRLYPTVPMMMRYAEYDLELDGCTVPQGTSCVIFAWGSCRSRKMWGEDAEEFIPERWSRADLPHPAAFSAFSYGRRSCLGKKYAMAFLKTILVHCLRKLDIKSDASGMKLEMNIAVLPIDGHHIQVRERKIPGI